MECLIEKYYKLTQNLRRIICFRKSEGSVERIPVCNVIRKIDGALYAMLW